MGQELKIRHCVLKIKVNTNLIVRTGPNKAYIILHVVIHCWNEDYCNCKQASEAHPYTVLSFKVTNCTLEKSSLTATCHSFEHDGASL